ncbi:hypothetical protein N7495_002940 [Penicillium taxi]|uniref:uncharacterized protein n=1 Tax=Penicillium taxi TaxID=168475 RepID=UPI0025456977|nr:uncharacterized protein N7495_002940 [Penicillium taxi]KAJ5902412.1 hypothetical protein N7495_002940 [Penicillium taxi]
MKIVIVGAGVSGCSIYLSLQKHLPNQDEHNYTIYEAYDTARDTTFRERPASTEDTGSATLVVGGGLGLGPNGLNVLKRLDSSLYQDVMRSGYPYSNFQIKGANGWTLMKVQATANVKGQEMDSLAMSRHSIWQCLRDRIPNSAIINKKIQQVIPHGGALGRHLITFVDGSSPVEADLVIGSDGLKGLVGVGGFHPTTESLQRNIQPGTMTITFGGNGFFGYVYSPSPSSPESIITWWSTFGMEECPDPKTADKAAITQDLRDRHANWQDPVIQEIIKSVNVETMWPTWTTPELPIWDKDGIVLLGDAAHALPPTSGQGSAQALEDSESFSLFLAHYLKKAHRNDGDFSERDAVQLAAKKHMALRYPRVKVLLEKAQQRQQSKKKMNLLQEYTMYIILWLVGKLSPANPAKAVLEYDMSEEVQTVLADEN